MTTAHFYKHLNRCIPRIQSFASELSTDFDTARFLYQETTHQAIKNKTHLDQDTFEDWLIHTMKQTYYKLVKKNSLS